jgi:hypothetical protein
MSLLSAHVAVEMLNGLADSPAKAATGWISAACGIVGRASHGSAAADEAVVVSRFLVKSGSTGHELSLR